MPQDSSAGPWTQYQSVEQSGPWTQYQAKAPGSTVVGALSSALPSSDSSSMPSLPFLDRTILAAMDNPAEQKAFLTKKYGADAVSKDDKGFIVTVGGKKMRASTGFLANVAAEAPETVLGIIGAGEGGTLGSALGPVGTVAGAVSGAGIGAAAGKTVKEAVKAASGLYHKTPAQYGEQIAGAAAGGMEGELIGRGTSAAFGRLTGGPLPHWVTESTPESRAMTERMVDKGARPPPLSTMPGSRHFQRITILADKLTSPSAKIDRINSGYLQDRASEILDKAGVGKIMKDTTMARLEGGEQSSLPSQEVGKLIQTNAQMMLNNVGKNSKIAAYLRNLSAPGKTPEDAYTWLTAPGQTDRLDRFVKIMGKDSAVVSAVQQQALKHILSGAMVRTADFGSSMAEGGKGLQATDALIKEMAQYTPKQQKMLFPNGLDDDLKLFAKEIRFLYPGNKDPAMAGITAGAIMQHAWYSRIWAQATYAMFRSVLQHPTIIRRLAVGFRGPSVQRIAARKALQEMLYFGMIEMNKPNEDPTQRHGVIQR